MAGRFLAGGRSECCAQPWTLAVFAAAVIMFATAIAIGVAKKLGLWSIVASLVVGMALGRRSPMPLLTGHVDEMQAIAADTSARGESDPR